MIDRLAQMTAVLSDRNRTIAELRQQLYEAGVFAGRQTEAVTKALHHLEQAHQALHAGDDWRAMQDIARAMEILA
jgi:hypothetical protein